MAADLLLIVNDPAPGAYGDLPEAWRTLRNDRVRGFAENVNSALDVLWENEGPAAVVCVNFDLEMEPDVPQRLVEALLADDTLALAGAVLTRPEGGQAFSVGRPPTSVKEFTRAAGLRHGRPQRAVRAVLTRLPAWQRRNAAGEGSRLLLPEEYLPWTCLAIRREAWVDVGQLDERFEMYAEDIDWGRRAVQSGWRACLVDVGQVVHAERATRSPRTDEVYEQSHARFHDKWGRQDHARWQRRGQRLKGVLATRWLGR